MHIIPFPLPSLGEFSDCGPASLLTGSSYLPRVFIIQNAKSDNDAISKSSGLSRQMWPAVSWEICGMCDIPVKCGSWLTLEPSQGDPGWFPVLANLGYQLDYI